MSIFTFFRQLVLTIVSGLVLCSCNQNPSIQHDTGAQPLPVSNRPAILATIDAPGVEYSSRRTSSPPHEPVYYVDQVQFADGGTSVASTLLLGKDKWQVAFNGRPGPVYTAVGPVSISPDGSHFVYKAMVGSAWCLVVDGAQTSACFDDVINSSYTSDSKHLLVEYVKDAIHYLMIDNRTSTGSSSIYRTPRFNKDHSRIVYIDNITKKDMGRLVISDIGLANPQAVATNITDFLIEEGKDQVAAIEMTQAGKSRVIQFNLDKPTVVTPGPDYDQVTQLMFSKSGEDLFYFGKRGNVFFGVLNGREERLPDGCEPLLTAINKTDKSTVTLVKEGKVFSIYKMFRNSGRLFHGEYDSAEWLTVSADGAKVAFSAEKAARQFVVLNGKKGPEFDRVVSLMFSPDGKHLIYRVRKAGSRFVVVVDTVQNTVRQYPAYDHVHDVKFTQDGKSIAYGVKNGRNLEWKVEPL